MSANANNEKYRYVIDNDLFSIDNPRYSKRIIRTDSCWLWIGKTKGGYGTIRKTINGRSLTLVVPRLLCMMEYPNYDWKSSTHTRHSIGCKKNCIRPSHLTPGTPQENTNDRQKEGTHRVVTLDGEINGNSRLTNEQVLEIRRLREEEKLTLYKIAEKFPCSYVNVWYICNDKQWKHLK